MDMLAGIIDVAELNDIIQDFKDIPETIEILGKRLQKYEVDRLDTRRLINEAKSNLATAEATAVAFPDPARELKNEAQRKAYVTEKTEAERGILLKLENQMLELETERLDTQGQYDAAQRWYDALKHRAELVSSLLNYYAGRTAVRA